MEGGRVKRSLQLVPGRDFEIVPEPVWRALYHWYGANLSLPRPVSAATRISSAAHECDTKCGTSGNGRLYVTERRMFCLCLASWPMCKYKRADVKDVQLNI